MSNQIPTIMVVEDETLLLQAITKKLKLSNLDVISCASGQQAIDYLESLDELPDVVWLDYYLKDMNGLAFMQALKENERWSHIPVVVVSNSASPEKVHHMLALGVKKYILKAEYRLDEIIEMMLALIADSRGGEMTDGKNGGAAPASAPTLTTPPASPEATAPQPNVGSSGV